ncbi:hypothetical protein ACNHYB_11165 [Isoptericola jiangsuensis]
MAQVAERIAELCEVELATDDAGPLRRATRRLATTWNHVRPR